MAGVQSVCTREWMRPNMPVEEFLRFVLENDSASDFLASVRGATKTHISGFDAYARALLDWYLHGKRYFNSAGEEHASVEGLLLEALKVVSDSELLQRIEEALITAQR